MNVKYFCFSDKIASNFAMNIKMLIKKLFALFENEFEIQFVEATIKWNSICTKWEQQYPVPKEIIKIIQTKNSNEKCKWSCGKKQLS